MFNNIALISAAEIKKQQLNADSTIGRKKRGRPRKPHIKPYKLMMDEVLRSKIAEHAHQQGYSISQVISHACRMYLNREEKDLLG